MISVVANDGFNNSSLVRLRVVVNNSKFNVSLGHDGSTPNGDGSGTSDGSGVNETQTYSDSDLDKLRQDLEGEGEKQADRGLWIIGCTGLLVAIVLMVILLIRLQKLQKLKSRKLQEEEGGYRLLRYRLFYI